MNNFDKIPIHFSCFEINGKNCEIGFVPCTQTELTGTSVVTSNGISYKIIASDTERPLLENFFVDHPSNSSLMDLMSHLTDMKVDHLMLATEFISPTVLKIAELGISSLMDKKLVSSDEYRREIADLLFKKNIDIIEFYTDSQEMFKLLGYINTPHNDLDLIESVLTCTDILDDAKVSLDTISDEKISNLCYILRSLESFSSRDIQVKESYLIDRLLVKVEPFVGQLMERQLRYLQRSGLDKMHYLIQNINWIESKVRKIYQKERKAEKSLNNSQTIINKIAQNLDSLVRRFQRKSQNEITDEDVKKIIGIFREMQENCVELAGNSHVEGLLNVLSKLIKVEYQKLDASFFASSKEKYISNLAFLNQFIINYGEKFALLFENQQDPFFILDEYQDSVKKFSFHDNESQEVERYLKALADWNSVKIEAEDLRAQLIKRTPSLSDEEITKLAALNELLAEAMRKERSIVSKESTIFQYITKLQLASDAEIDELQKSFDSKNLWLISKEKDLEEKNMQLLIEFLTPELNRFDRDSLMIGIKGERNVDNENNLRISMGSLIAHAFELNDPVKQSAFHSLRQVVNHNIEYRTYLGYWVKSHQDQLSVETLIKKFYIDSQPDLLKQFAAYNVFHRPNFTPLSVGPLVPSDELMSQTQVERFRSLCQQGFLGGKLKQEFSLTLLYRVRAQSLKSDPLTLEQLDRFTILENTWKELDLEYKEVVTKRFENAKVRLETQKELELLWILQQIKDGYQDNLPPEAIERLRESLLVEGDIKTMSASLLAQTERNLEEIRKENKELETLMQESEMWLEEFNILSWKKLNVMSELVSLIYGGDVENDSKLNVEFDAPLLKRVGQKIFDI